MPFTCSDILQPWVHYVPVREDFADLWDRVMLCEAHLDKCEAISKRAQEYAQMFNNSERCEALGGISGC
jgi:siroheme synthase (precorrin-2 oxidase/ferrochelatase)